MTVYATYFDSAYLARGLACLESLRRCSAVPPRLLVLALDESSAHALGHLGTKFGLDRLEILPLAELEALYPELARAQGDRSRIEYYFTLTPFLCAEALKRTALNERAVYVDADLFFYADPQIALSAAGRASVAIVEHRFPQALAHLADCYGRFNVGWNAFLASEDASACIARWQQQCLLWCADLPNSGRFADQKYLDTWSQEISSLTIVTHPGVNLAPWNVARHKLSESGDNKVLVDGEELVFFHFHSLQSVGPTLYVADFGTTDGINDLLCRCVYAPYLRQLDSIENTIGCETSIAMLRRADRSSHLKWGWRTSVADRLLRMVRLLQRRRVVFRRGHALSRWRSLRYA
jgi:hypothetical protein